MKKVFNKKRWYMRLLAITTTISMTLPVGAFGANPAPLSQITNPVFGTLGGAVPAIVPAHLAPYITDMNAAVKLGKALFWDMQVGSDGIVACATCHYRAGADPIDVRSRNQINPGPNGTFDVVLGTNALLTSAEYPFFQVTPVDAPIGQGTVLNNMDDVTGSQGVRWSLFAGNDPITGAEITVSAPDPNGFIFNGNNIRRTTGANTPPAVNAVFNFANFWDGRANPIFNGSNPIGPMDLSAGIWDNASGTLARHAVAIPFSSLASQSTGPPLSDTEMSAHGRNWIDIGVKMLAPGVVPLGKQLVHPQDSVLGPLSNAAVTPGAKGLNTTYAAMIQAAFRNTLWNSTQPIPAGWEGTTAYSQMEVNFSLFWGLAIQAYEATLVSDQTPFDKFLAGDPTAMSQAAQNGFGRFQSRCASCHADSEMTEASVANAAFVSATNHNLIAKGATNVSNGLSDTGFINLGVRPTDDNIGRGAGAPSFPSPLAFAAQAELFSLGTLSFTAPVRLLAGQNNTDPLAVNGSFKVPSIRNIALTAPYMHNGSMFTLDEVVEFYARGGNFANAEMDANFSPMGDLAGGSGAAKRAEIVAFLNALTDPRVADESAPFDHPELILPMGDVDNAITLPATGTVNIAPLPVGTIVINGGAALTKTLSGTLALSATGSNPIVSMRFSKDGVFYYPWEPYATTRSVSLLPGDGIKTVYVKFMDSAGNISLPISDTITLNTTAPTGTIAFVTANPTTSAFGLLALTASDTNGVTQMQFSKNGSGFYALEPFSTSRTVSLAPGLNTLTVRFKDAAGNLSVPYSTTITRN